MSDPLSSPGSGAPRPRGPASAAEFAKAWWVPLVSGVINVIAGLVVLIEPHNSLLAIALVLGIYLVIAGVFALATGIASASHRGAVIAFALLAIVAGIFVIARPGSAVHGVRIVFGIYLLIVGLAHIGTIAMPHVDSRGRELLLGALEIVAGIVFLAVPKLGLAAVALFFGIYLLIRGALEIALALALRDAKHEASG
jgi:uncharacterized membrane protein HdeD (DUF308 family)